MSEFTTVGKASEVSPGELGIFEVNGVPVAVANVDGTYYAFSDICTHEECNLSDGMLEETRVECPCHGSAFDVTNGAVLSAPATEPVDVYPIRVEGEELLIQA